MTRFNCKKINAFHTLWGSGIDRFVGFLMLLGNDAIIATNSEIMFLIETYFPFVLKKTYWIPIGSNIASLSAPEDADDDKIPVISFFGMLYPGKGLDLIIEVLMELKRKGHSFYFKFIGGGMLNHEEYERTFHSTLIKTGLRGSVEHLGMISEQQVSYWLNKSRFLFLPYEMGVSDRRGSLIAAISHGKAVLTSPPAVSMPFFKNGDNILWPEYRSLISYTTLFENLLYDDGLVGRLEKGAKSLSRFFDWNQIAFEYELAMKEFC